MTDEERKAVDKINKLVEYLRKWNENVTIVPADIKFFEKILDMIKTYTRMIDENIEEILEQSKEIEELKNGQIDFWISDKEIEERIRNKFVSKDKIKAKIEELEKLDFGTDLVSQFTANLTTITILQSLLNEEE